MRIFTVLTSILLLVVLVGTASAQQDPPRLNKAIELMENDQAVFGLLSFDYSLNNARSMANSGLDFIIIDMEHAPFDVQRLRHFLLGMTDKRKILEKGSLQPDVVPLVRIPATGGEDVMFQAKQVLDVGAFGVMYPSVSTRAQAEKSVGATRYPQLNGAERLPVANPALAEPMTSPFGSCRELASSQPPVFGSGPRSSVTFCHRFVGKLP